MGLELAGEVEATGEEVKNFRRGDQVFAFTGFYFGAYAEYKCMAEDGAAKTDGLVTKKPENLSFREAAAVPSGGLTALGIIRKADIKKDQKVLIYGASGSIGTYAVQLAKVFGGRVTGVCSTSNLEMVSSLGADAVIDYTKEDFTKSGEKYDVIIDAVHKKSRAFCKRALKNGGVFLSAHSSTVPGLEDLIFLRELLEADKIRPVIDRCYPIEQVADAHRYVDQGRKKGNVVLTLD
ncbi:alcohol dehydrogenase, zinc-containing [Fulvivirga imtechensis AK7]|uniref:Alcohol dehydrogenase, zinc-containing n=1 Tax=Fulvivirga imtechensis AK7 TaxID=1237149 RepID=L8JT93_9BACT|nr:alcohol dehydrogenase, zinc-containing [Fulvivirga imtechensis AK7]